jgi:SAM-dependent methyltransferase
MEYWDKRFLDEGKIWGDKPSKSAFYAIQLFKKYDIMKILIPGSGYGRNSKLFSNAKFEVTGIEISKIGVELARNFDKNTRFFEGSILNMPFSNEIYDAIYCFNVLHLFLKEDRFILLRKCFNQLKTGGYIFFTVFSEKEKSFGKGKQIEHNTFESKPGRPTHYFSQNDLKKHFADYNTIDDGIIKEEENHGNLGKHTHILRYIFARKENKK